MENHKKFTNSELTNYKQKLDEANNIHENFQFFAWAVLFGVIANLLTNIIHDWLKGYTIIYPFIVISLFFYTSIKLISFVIKKMESKYKNEKLYKYFIKK